MDPGLVKPHPRENEALHKTHEQGM